ERRIGRAVGEEAHEVLAADSDDLPVGLERERPHLAAKHAEGKGGGAAVAERRVERAVGEEPGDEGQTAEGLLTGARGEVAVARGEDLPIGQEESVVDVRRCAEVAFEHGDDLAVAPEGGVERAVGEVPEEAGELIQELHPVPREDGAAVGQGEDGRGSAGVVVEDDAVAAEGGVEGAGLREGGGRREEGEEESEEGGAPCGGGL